MTLTVTQALVLGAIHGPAELLPVSSSAHVQLVPRLLGWDHDALPADTRKAFEVGLHAGSLLVMLAAVPWPSPADALVLTTPGAIAGTVLEEPIEQRLGGTRGTAAGLVAGALLMLAANGSNVERAENDAMRHRVHTRRALRVGVAQALALIPGLSRLGMAYSAGRLSGLDRREALEFGRSAGLPLTAGAVLLKTLRLRRTGLAPELRTPFAAGFAASAASTALALPLRRRAPIRTAAAWRVLLAAAALRQNVPR
ncbi:MAG: undecaprenyl-diphosphate phosphatase [Baekduia sp.]